MRIGVVEPNFSFFAAPKMKQLLSMFLLTSSWKQLRPWNLLLEIKDWSRPQPKQVKNWNYVPKLRNQKCAHNKLVLLKAMMSKKAIELKKGKTHAKDQLAVRTSKSKLPKTEILLMMIPAKMPMPRKSLILNKPELTLEITMTKMSAGTLTAQSQPVPMQSSIWSSTRPMDQLSNSNP